MGEFTGLQLDTGILLKKFDSESTTVPDADITGIITGGITVGGTLAYSDFEEEALCNRG